MSLSSSGESEEEIPVPISPGRTAEKDQEASRPHPPPLIILPTAGIPSSSSHSRLNLCWNMAAGAILAKRWPRGRGGGWRGGLGRRRRSSWPCVSVVERLHISCQTLLHTLSPSSLHPPPSSSLPLSLSFWHGHSLRYSPA